MYGQAELQPQYCGKWAVSLFKSVWRLFLMLNSKILEKLLQEWHQDPTNKVLIFTKSIKLLTMLAFHLKNKSTQLWERKNYVIFILSAFVQATVFFNWMGRSRWPRVRFWLYFPILLGFIWIWSARYANDRRVSRKSRDFRVLNLDTGWWNWLESDRSEQSCYFWWVNPISCLAILTTCSRSKLE